MKKWLVFVLGILTGIVLMFLVALILAPNQNSRVDGLELLEEPAERMDYTYFEIFQVLKSGDALAKVSGAYGPMVFIIPNENQHFYDDQEIYLKNGQYAQRVGTFKYTNKAGQDKTVPAIKIVQGVDSEIPEGAVEPKGLSGITLFDKPGECVSRQNFQVQQVLDSGDAIAKEISFMHSGSVLTTDLEVLFLANEDSHFYNNQILKAPKGTCARQIGNYKYDKYGNETVIPIVAYK